MTDDGKLKKVDSGLTLLSNEALKTRSSSLTLTLRGTRAKDDLVMNVRERTESILSQANALIDDVAAISDVTEEARGPKKNSCKGTTWYIVYSFFKSFNFVLAILTYQSAPHYGEDG